mmetsp:Transcript_71341/g.113059  ORF Transcript_71341/g.113059 Transcript_71341/m.113059 type:complete len:216 (-) Transcript_71341:800-1447(-)
MIPMHHIMTHTTDSKQEQDPLHQSKLQDTHSKRPIIRRQALHRRLLGTPHLGTLPQSTRVTLTVIHLHPLMVATLPPWTRMQLILRLMAHLHLATVHRLGIHQHMEHHHHLDMVLVTHLLAMVLHHLDMGRLHLAILVEHLHRRVTDASWMIRKGMAKAITRARKTTWLREMPEASCSLGCRCILLGTQYGWKASIHRGGWQARRTSQHYSLGSI